MYYRVVVVEAEADEKVTPTSLGVEFVYQILSRAPIRGREHTPPEGTTMLNKKIPIRVYYAETHDCSYAFLAGVNFIANNILLLCGDFKNVGLAKSSL